jgi:hypothetical protein
MRTLFFLIMRAAPVGKTTRPQGGQTSWGEGAFGILSCFATVCCRRRRVVTVRPRYLARGCRKIASVWTAYTFCLKGKQRPESGM